MTSRVTSSVTTYVVSPIPSSENWRTTIKNIKAISTITIRISAPNTVSYGKEGRSPQQGPEQRLIATQNCKEAHLPDVIEPISS